MKKSILLLLVSFFVLSCSTPKVKDYVSYEVNGAWYWVTQYQFDATETDVKAFVNRWSNPNQTSYFFAYPASVDLSAFKNLSFAQFQSIIVDTPPTYGHYKMPNDNTIYDDAVWLMETSKK